MKVRIFRAGSIAWVFATLAALVVGLSGPRPASADPAPTGKFILALLQVTFSDQSDSVHAYSVATMQQAANEMSAYYGLLSYQKLNLLVVTARVRLGNTTAYYEGHCDADIPLLDHCYNLTQDAVAAEKAVAPGFFNGVSAVSIVIPGSFHSFTVPPLSGIGTPADPVEAAYLEEGQLMNPPGFGPCCPSLVFWGGWAHELGHQLQYAAHLNVGGKWNGHPSGYNSGYDLMDSCYPCGQAPYGLLGPPYHNDNRGAFGGWLNPSNVAVMPPPTGPVGMTFTLPALSAQLKNPETQSVEVRLDSNRAYYVNVRTRTGADSLQTNTPQGIHDEGVQIEFADDNADPPMTVCSPVPAGFGCVPNPNPTSNWPFLLWHVGQTMQDNTNNVAVSVVGKVNGGYTVQVTQNVPPGRPNLYIIPWLTPPENTYETVDIWVDSSCNGYEDQGGILRYGRRGDGTVIGSGDDPCVNHENRVYATIHNGGTVTSSPSSVQFQVTNPPGVGPTGSWLVLGTVSLPAILPHHSATVYTTWTPVVNLTPQQIQEERFEFHTCIQVTVAPSTNEVILTDNQAQENIDYFEARAAQAVNPHYAPIQRVINIRNPYLDQQPEFDPHRLFFLESQSKLPRGWRYRINNGQQRVTLAPNEFRQLPVLVMPGPGVVPVGKFFTFDVQAYTHKTLFNRALPKNNPNASHFTFGNVGGATIVVHTVVNSTMDLSATTIPGTTEIQVQGQLKPVHNQPATIVALDYTNSSMVTTTRLVKTDTMGKFADLFQAPSHGMWQIRGIWQGDMTYSAAVSAPVVLNFSLWPRYSPSHRQIERLLPRY